MPLPAHHRICSKLFHHPPENLLRLLLSRFHHSARLPSTRRFPSPLLFHGVPSLTPRVRDFSSSAASLAEDFHPEVERTVFSPPPPPPPPPASASSFYAGEDVSWKCLGVSDDVSAALCSVSLQRPSLVQASCIPQIFTGKDVVIAAETGSGKTHAYLVPLIDRLYNMLEHPEKEGDGDNDSQRHGVSLILCPNVMLCEQVVKMANTFCNKHGEPLLRVSSVCGRNGWPFEQPDVIVSTPAALLNSLYAFGGGRLCHPGFIRDLKYVVFDEADMLLCGSFQNQIIRLINLFRFEEKKLSRMEYGLNFQSKMDNELISLSSDSSKTESEIASSEMLEDSKSMKPVNDSMSSSSEILEDSKSMKPVNDSISSESGEDNDMGVQVPEDEPSFCNMEGEAVHDDIFDNFEVRESKLENTKKNDWRRVRKIYKRSKQYIFVAATLPGSGKRTAGGILRHMFPDAVWVSGDYLHCHNPRLEQRWVEVTVDTQVDALLNAVKSSFKDQPIDSSTGIERTMVFVNTVDAAESVATILQQVGITCLSYHSAGSFEERMNKLSSFREKGGILVCTDAAARGLDIPNISHVIQAEFATSAVDFLHRIGRTARAGQYGVVTSFYTESNRDLVSAVRQAEKLGQSVEKAFSRKRSFRNKLKKRGLHARSVSSPSRETIPA